MGGIGKVYWERDVWKNISDEHSNNKDIWGKIVLDKPNYCQGP